MRGAIEVKANVGVVSEKGGERGFDGVLIFFH
jgi:hypothetical protein